MHTRPVRTDELDLFIETAPDHHREVRQYMERMFAAGSMRPEWCFIAEEEQGEGPLGRVAFWTLPGMEEPFALVLLMSPGMVSTWTLARAYSGTYCRRHVLLGPRRSTGFDDRPMQPQFQDHRERRVELLESVGFAFHRETGRFEWRGGQPPAIPVRLSFRA